MSEIRLPSVVETTIQVIEDLSRTLHFPRDILASRDDIERAWNELPRLLGRVPENTLHELHVRMCIAVGTGLFDSAINYAWNSGVIALRQRVRQFGLNIVAQIKSNQFDENTLLEMTDANLLKLCLELNLLSEDAFFFLDQSREIRNNFSAAHPPIATLDADEMVVFLARITKYALSPSDNPQGVDTTTLFSALKADRFTPAQELTWIDRFRNTHDAQREQLIQTLHGIYCDPNSSEEARINSQNICIALSAEFSPKAVSSILNRHSEYGAQGESDKQARSRVLFQKMGLLARLSNIERHSIVSKACASLISAHNGFNNFHNEPPFAERLQEITSQGIVPESAQQEFVEAVVSCALGNDYGVSHAALPFYQKMVRNFNPREIAIMFTMSVNSKSMVYRKLKDSKRKARFVNLIAEIDDSSVPTNVRKIYDNWIALGL